MNNRMYTRFNRVSQLKFYCRVMKVECVETRDSDLNRVYTLKYGGQLSTMTIYRNKPRYQRYVEMNGKPYLKTYDGLNQMCHATLKDLGL